MNQLSASSITVILATYNGSSILDKTLAGYSHQSATHISWNIVVINNGSNDDTAEIIEKWQHHLPMTVINDPEPGKNHALNKAISLIGVDDSLYIFTDDDAIPEPDFVEQWHKVLKEQPKAMLFGGTVIPHFSQTPPEWLTHFSKHYPEIYAQNQFESQAGQADRIFGPNMAVRGAVLRAGHRFDENIGPNSSDSHYPMGSETEFCVRVESALGKGCVYMCSDAIVQHQVRPHQMTREFVESRAFRHGRGYAMQRHLARKTEFPVLSKLLYRYFKWKAASRKASQVWQFNWLCGYRDYFMAEKKKVSSL